MKKRKSSETSKSPRAVSVNRAPLQLKGKEPDAQAMTDSPAAIEVKKAAREKLVDRVIENAPKVTGTRTTEMADRIITQVGGALVWPREDDASVRILKASAAIAEMAPKNATEAMLATQMIATNEAALSFLNRATLETQHTEAIDANVHRATRLMRLFCEQLDAMHKLKGNAGQQRVTVEHVHVHEGGQAVVGAVTTKGQEGGV